MITCRRYYLDMFLKREAHRMCGNVLDIGGTKTRNRGAFRPPLEQVQSWKYLNIDACTEPDYCCSAENIPLEPESVDGFLLCEVLEHLKQPEKVLSEAFRILKPGSTGWITMPFLYQVHADPHDYQRWTKAKLQQMLEKAGFTDVHIEPMGSVVAVMYDLWHAFLSRSSKQGRFLNRVFSRFLRALGPVALAVDKKLTHYNEYINTGYSAVVWK
ncbi:MAG: methyltransferase domain-containing protein [Desulfobacteraceae bacterium]|nr:methyltransferase domain-containing protein [Desulfobacteraceae bacterium]